jgi:hypothetical protein
VGVGFSSVTARGCTNPFEGATTVTRSGTWTLVITGDATGTVWPAKLANINAAVIQTGCAFTVGGGNVVGTFDTSTQTFIPTNSTLTITNTPTGGWCPLSGTAFGDEISVSGSWTNTGAPITLSNP